jgi:precorrin-6A/cobalt-precorrin-6A reductase
MILLIGGTSETGPLAEALALNGFEVLVSTATDVFLEVGVHERISRRVGALDASGLSALVQEKGIRLIVDASHPYAAEVHSNAAVVTEGYGIPLIIWDRPSCEIDEDFIINADDHEEAARFAFSYGRTVLLTTGSRNLVPYARESRAKGVPLIVRVLDHPDSIRACNDAGIPPENFITGRGPFTLEENLMTIRKHHIGVLVTKDSGKAGGVPEKIEAARIENCKVVMIRRPEVSRGTVVRSIPELIGEIALR